MATQFLVSFVSLIVLSFVRADCPKGFTHHDDSCYWAVGVRATWAESSVYCHVFGSKLVSVETESEMNFLKSLLQHLPGSFDPKNFWLGGSDMEKEGNWVWTKSGQALTYTNWASGQPDNGSGAREHCMDIRESHHWLWGDNNCDDRAYFVCEKSDISGPLVVG